MGLCFGFVLKTVLITQGCFRYCWAVLTQSQGLFCFSPHPTSEQAGGAQEAGRGHSRDSWPQLTKGIVHTIGCHAQLIKLGEEEGRWGHLALRRFVFPSNHYTWWMWKGSARDWQWWFLRRVREESYAWKTLPKHYCYGYLIDNLKVGRHEIRCLLIFWPLSFASVTWLVTPELAIFEGAFGKEE